ncbi:MAG: DNA mismatch repair endonuclease MutL [Flavobacteriales bacterium]
MSDIIKLLPENIANQIAAGEVVQRPASVVKELMENSIDAGATSIKLFAKDAGKTLIQLTDNGKGMSAIDARLCFERHATSKITTSEDLFHIQTKGFRGEALSSIAAVAQVEMRTRQEQDEVGTQVTIEASKVQNQEPVQCQVGTTFFVKNLFYNVPARRYFLKSDAIELRHIIDEFQRIALTHPEVEFQLTHNGAEVFMLPISTLRQRIVHVFGSKYNEKLVPVEEYTDIVGVTGFIGKPETAKKTRGEQFFFVNRRFIKNTYLNHAVTSAFQDLLPQGNFPLYLLYLEIDPAQIDINIHPTKTEIKFQDERAVYAIIHAAVRRALGKFSIAPSIDFNQETSISISPLRSGEEIQPPKIDVNPSFNPFGTETTTSNRSLNLRGWFDRKENSASGWQDLMEVAAKIEHRDQQSALLELDVHDEMLFIQHSRKYLVCSSGERMLIIDQQRAHQRIRFEQLLSSMENGQATVQHCLFPETIELTATQSALINSYEDVLQSLGFRYERASSDTIRLEGIPTECSHASGESLLMDALAALENDDEPSLSANEKLCWKLVASGGIRYGQMLTMPEMESLFQQLMQCNQPYFWRNQKPIIVQLDAHQLTAYFS